MTLESIFVKVHTITKFDLQQDAHTSLNIPDNIFYIFPQFIPLHMDADAKFVIFSAPGASGKSTLAKYIVDCYGGIYWDLSKIAIGENTFQGTLWKALGQEKLFEFWDNLKSGNGILAIDAFDEAELISGRAGVEYFLNDINDVTKGYVFPTISLFARTETSKFIEQYCIANNISYCMFEISFFAEAEAKEFVQQRYIRLGNKYTAAVEQCIDTQFDVIKELLNTTEMSESFLGYAPVLETLSIALDNSNNTIQILEDLRKDVNASAKIVFKILKELMKREQEKVVNALKERCNTQLQASDKVDEIYSENEQHVRIMEYIFFHKVEEDSLYYNDCISADIYTEYIEILRSQLLQHPFLQNLNKKNEFDFAGPSFRDYVLSCIMCSDYNDFAYEYLQENGVARNKTSQLLFDFFIAHNGIITDSNFCFVYDAFKAKENVDVICKVSAYLFGDDGYVIFSQLSSENRVIEETLVPFICNNSAITIFRVSNTIIITDKEVNIGKRSLNTQISNSCIIADKIVLSTKQLLIASSLNNNCTLISKRDVSFNEMGMPKFDIRCGNEIKISFPNINVFNKLRKYSFIYEDVHNEEFIQFYIFISRVLGLISKHKQSIGVKDKEFIDNKIIRKNPFKRSLMNFLIDIGIIYRNHNVYRYYELDVDRLAQYGLNQIILTLEREKELRELYSMFVESKEYREYLNHK